MVTFDLCLSKGSVQILLAQNTRKKSFYVKWDMSRWRIRCHLSYWSGIVNFAATAKWFNSCFINLMFSLYLTDYYRFFFKIVFATNNGCLIDDKFRHSKSLQPKYVKKKKKRKTRIRYSTNYAYCSITYEPCY